MATYYHDHVSRSVTKAITFRILIIVADTIVIFALTRRVDLTLGVLFFSNISSTILYFLHERAWNKVHWGKINHHKRK